MSVEWTTYVLVFLIVAAGTFIQVNIGFGVGVVNMVFFPMLFPFPTAVALNVSIATAAALFVTVGHWRYIQWKTMLPVLAVVLAISTAAILLSLQAEQAFLKIALGAVFIGLSIYFYRFADRISIKPSLRNGLFMGILAGLGNGLFGISGPPAALYFMASLPGKQEYLASIQAFVLFSNIGTLGVRAATGSLRLTHLPLVAVGWVGAAFGMWMGFKMFNKLPEALTKKLVYAFVGVSGAVTIVQAVLSMRQ